MIGSMLNKDINYIVSGLERSGTSMIMQILEAGGIPIGFDLLRGADESNPKGYYELAGGKIINQLMNGTIFLDDYKGKFIKITAYGLRFLPFGMYKIIYMERNLDEVIASMEKMASINDIDRELTRESFQKLNKKIKREMNERTDIEILFINYNEIIRNPQKEIRKIVTFLESTRYDLQNMIKVIDEKLYRERR